MRDKEPCQHPGCLNHVTRHCEGCGRVAGKSKLKGVSISKGAGHQRILELNFTTRNYGLAFDRLDTPASVIGKLHGLAELIRKETVG